MKKIILGITLYFLVLNFSFGQEIVEKKYYKGKYGGIEVSERKAKYVDKTIKRPDGTLTYEFINLKKNKVARSWSFKDDIPVGIWKDKNGRETDYNFKLTYNKEEYHNIVKFDMQTKTLSCVSSASVSVPIFPFLNNNFQYYVAKETYYPTPAQEKGITGSVELQFVINDTGKVSGVSVLKSAGKILDKESVRVILNSPDWIPASLDEKPISVYVTTTVNFAMQ